MAIAVTPRTVPPAGVDTVDITIHETYEIDGVGRDTVELKGQLVANRTVPLLGHGATAVAWETSTVVAQFTELNLTGKSPLFGDVNVSLDKSVPSYGVVSNAKCAAAIGVKVEMPQHGLTLRSSEPIQLQSTVQTVPPIGDESTQSVKAVDLLDSRTDKPIGTILQARVMWRDLVQQQVTPVTASVRAARAVGAEDERVRALEAENARLKTLLAEAILRAGR
ncbi:DUF6073 family protein [Bradyrhizobium sp. HKCCYLS1011]|uniref:DUF6073 family protein n=1 Tax=Bradyrhizobium sp. HKCCYLS1011 TaxID=3420733 RepID=UPI003EBD3869